MMVILFFFFRIRRPPRSTRTATLFPSTTLFRSWCIRNAERLAASPPSRWCNAAALSGSARPRLQPAGFDRLGLGARADGAERGEIAARRGHLAHLDQLVADRGEFAFEQLGRHARSEERRVGKAWVSTCRYRWSPYPSKKKNKK